MQDMDQKPAEKQINASSDILEQPRIKEILTSDSSFEILLYRLKQSIKVCDEFASFIRRKHNYEEEYARNMRKTAATCKNSIDSNCVSAQGYFTESLKDVIGYDERLVTDVRRPYIKALETMYSELSSLSQTFTRLRKRLKEEGNKREKEVSEAINQAEKSRNKYQSVCADLEKLRNSDQSQKKMTLQGRKTGPQQEEELNRKLHVADADYNKKAYYSQKLKNELIDTHRPQIANRLKDLILELEHALQMQLSKYAVFNESLVIGMGNQITPLGHAHPSMQETVSSVDVEKSLYSYLINSKVEKKAQFVPVEYKRHAVFGAIKPDGSFDRATGSANTSFNQSGFNSRVTSGSSTGSGTGSGFKGPSTTIGAATLGVTSLGPSALTGPRPMKSPVGNTPAIGIPKAIQIQQKQQELRKLSQQSQQSRKSSEDAPALSVSSTQGKIPMLEPTVSSSQSRRSSNGTYSSDSNQKSPQGLLFGVAIDQIPHDDEMVPLFVKKCIKILEDYGSECEGIYRSSPNKMKMEQLKDIVDTDPTNLNVLDPPNPENVSKDYICVIASLLKKFFSMLPEPLLTFEQTNNFMKAGQIEDIQTMHLQLHRIVFELPDANYFTLRDLLFHFIRLSRMPKVRMSGRNLAIVWSNNLFLRDSATTPQDLHLQQRVIEELINAAPDIFNPIEDDSDA